MPPLARATTITLVATLLTASAACSGAGDLDSAPSPDTTASTSTPPPGMDESLRDAALALVEVREQALVEGDREAFLATVDPGGEFATTQARWFDNLTRLPVTDISLELGDEDVMTRIHGEGDLQLPVDVTMRLEGFDQRPVTQPQVYTFVGDTDGVVLAADRNVQMDAMNRWQPAPWDVTEITVEQTDRVLGIFDADTESSAEEVVAATEDALRVVDGVVPPWPGTVTLYDIADVDALDQMSLMEVDDTGGVAFPVPVRPGSRKVAGQRIMVNPAALGTGSGRDLLLRHELTHAALGRRDDSSPAWLVEGTAEYVATSTYVTETRRRLYAYRLRGSRTPRLRHGRDFYQVDHSENYDIAGAVCVYLVTTRGASVLWDLMGAFDRSQAYSAGDIDRVLRRELGRDAAGLVADTQAWVGVD